MATFGSKDKPVRASSTPTLFQCSKAFWIKSMGEFESSEAADTGSMVHLGIQIFHALGEGKETEIAAQAAIHKSVDQYKHGNTDEAISQFKSYVKRERQDRRGKVIFGEQKIRLTIAPHESDTTGEEIVIDGTVDQIRQAGEWYYVNDIKTGQQAGANMVQMYLPQLACYMAMAMQQLKTEKVKAFILRTRDLISSRNPFYWPMPLTPSKVDAVLDTIAYKIAVIRNGVLDITPGKHCDYCNDPRYYPDCIDNEGQLRPPKETATEIKRGRVSLPHVNRVRKSADELFGVKRS
jgi:hypothetical protein